MLPNRTDCIRLSIFLILFAGLLSACGGSALPSHENYVGRQVDNPGSKAGNPAEAISEQQIYPVDALFTEFYNTLGGQKILGPAISPVSGDGTRLFQYVENAQLVYDETATVSDQFNLAPLGLEFDVAEEPPSHPSRSEGRYVGGHLIWSEFVALYDALGGVRFVGEPLTEARHDSTRNRTEQYFENLGFYRLDQDQPGLVRLMAYGAFACDYRCRYQSPSSSIPGRQPNLPEPFRSQAERLGTQFTGRALTGIHLASDLTEEIIFENIVLTKDGSVQSGVSARPIVELLGFLAHAPVDPKHDPIMAFYELEDGKGHNVPRLFDEYIQQHGGIVLTGLPQSEVFPIRTGAFRQCFTNLCLEYDINANGPNRLQPVPLGMRYKEEIFEKTMDFQESLSVKNIDLHLWEAYRWLPAGQPQQIFVAVSEDEVALKNREPILILSIPNEKKRMVYFPPTGSDGRTSIEIPGILAPNGTLITYDVCLMGFNGEQRCVGENYLIWNSK